MACLRKSLWIALLTLIQGASCSGEPIATKAANVSVKSGGGGATAKPVATDDEMDQKVIGILQAKCVRCHDDRKTGAASGVDNLLKLEDFYSGYHEDQELVGGDKPKMPKQKFKDVEWAGPLTADEQRTLVAWFKRGGPSEAYRAARQVQPRTPITEKTLVEKLAADLAKLKGAELENARYLTLSNLYNNTAISLDDLEAYRHGTVKMLNSLSRVADVVGLDSSNAPHRVIAVDDERTVFRFDLRHIGWTNQLWDRVAAHYPYALLQRGGNAKSVYTLTSSKLPYLRADWFVFATSQPPLYHELLGIPDTLAKLEESLGINRLDAIRKLQVARAGFEYSKVSVNNRLIERIMLTTRPGAYHISYDFGTNDGEQNFFENPFGPIGAFGFKQVFRHDGGEVIFPLPNGFLAYMLVTADGKRLDIAPQAIVTDPTMPGGVIINGVSCISCHYQGMKPEKGDSRLKKLDEVRESALKNFRRFNEKEREVIEQIYPPHDEFEKLIEQDRQRFLTALSAAGIEIRGSEEPVRALFDRFARDLDLNAVAAEFGLTPEECRQQMDRESETRQLLRRIERGTLKRQLYLSAFQTIARLTGAGDVEEFQKVGFPYFGEKGEVSTVAATGTDHKQGDKGVGLRERHGIDLLDAESRNADLKVDIKTDSDQRHFRDGETIPCFIRTTQDAFLTVLAVNPTGEIVLLAPNRWVPEWKVKAGQTVRIPNEQMEFEFAATEPHGITELRVIATKRPLQIRGVTTETMKGTKGLLELGRSKGIGVRPRTETLPPQPSATHPELTDKKLNELFLPNEWATGRLTLTTSR